MNAIPQVPPELLQKLEKEPENPSLWRQLLFRYFERNQTDIVYTLQVVVKGLEELAKLREIRNPKVANQSLELGATLYEFAQAPKSRELLVEIGKHYENDYEMFEAAKAHNERAMALGRDESKNSASKSKSLVKPAPLPSEIPSFGVAPSLERPNLQITSPGEFFRKNTQAIGASWPELQTKLEDTLVRIQRRMSNTWGASSVRALRLPKTIPALQWLDFLEAHLSVQFSVQEIKHLDSLAVPPGPLSHRENAVLRGQDLLSHLEKVELLISGTTNKTARTQVMSQALVELTEHISEISEFIRSGRLSEAEAKLAERATESVPPEQLSTLWSNLGLQFQNRHDSKKALAAYQKAVVFYADNLQSWFNSGLILQADRNFPAALQCYLKAAHLAPAQPKIWCNLGVLQYEIGDHKSSVESLRRAVEINPDYTRAWDNLATSLCAMEEFRGAERCCQRAMKLNPELADPPFKLGFINFKLGNLTAAEHNFYTALKLQPGYPLAEFYLVVIMARMDRLAEAHQICEVAVAPPTEFALPAMAWSELGYGFFNLADFQTSLHCYEKVLEYTPERANAWYDAGIVHHRMGNISEARRHYAQATTLDSEQVQMWQSLVAVCREMGDTAEAYQAQLEVDRLGVT